MRAVATVALDSPSTMRVVQSLTTVLEDGLPARVIRKKEEPVVEKVPSFDRVFTVLR
jgi:hypothetical protein